MNKRVKRAWIDALRSGEYKQGQYVLCDKYGRYCCLGVLIDIAADGYWEWDRHGCWAFRGHKETLPLDLQDNLGIFIRHQADLMNMNDAGHSFTEIADWIEENL